LDPDVNPAAGVSGRKPERRLHADGVVGPIGASMNRHVFSKAFLVLLLVLISAVFLVMISSFLMTIVMAAIFSALSRPLFRRMQQSFGGRTRLAAGLTLAVIFFAILLPLGAFLGAVAAEAVKFGQSVTPWVQEQITSPGALSETLKDLPFYDRMLPYKEAILQRAGELAGKGTGFLINSVSSVTVFTAQYVLLLFILLYTMYFFLVDGDRILKRMLYYLPLPPADEERMLENFLSVTRATLKSFLVIGVLQGGLTGIAFALAGVPSYILWGAVAAVASLVPAIGTAAVWVPASIILAMGGHVGKAIGVFVFCAVVVANVDFFLRPRLVGKDTQMHELMALFGTLGGIAVFGMAGFIIGPIVAALVVTVWDMYGVAFREQLPPETLVPGRPVPPPANDRILLAREDPGQSRR
jgi:predicted PurR-regulated permease PerM